MNDNGVAVDPQAFDETVASEMGNDTDQLSKMLQNLPKELCDKIFLHTFTPPKIDTHYIGKSYKPSLLLQTNHESRAIFAQAYYTDTVFMFEQEEGCALWLASKSIEHRALLHRVVFVSETPRLLTHQSVSRDVPIETRFWAMCAKQSWMDCHRMLESRCVEIDPKILCVQIRGLPESGADLLLNFGDRVMVVGTVPYHEEMRYFSAASSDSLNGFAVHRRWASRLKSP